MRGRREIHDRAEPEAMRSRIGHFDCFVPVVGSTTDSGSVVVVSMFSSGAGAVVVVVVTTVVAGTAVVVDAVAQMAKKEKSSHDTTSPGSYMVSVAVSCQPTKSKPS